MTKTIALIVAFAFVSGSAFAQKLKEYKPGETPEQAQVTQDPVAKAKENLEKWKAAKRDCFVKSGLTENVNWKISETNRILIKDDVFLTPTFDHAAIKACLN